MKIIMSPNYKIPLQTAEGTGNDDWGLGKVLGSGSFGEVNLWTKGGQHIAIKKFQLSYVVSSMAAAKARDRWEVEVARMSKLSHPHIVKTVKLPEGLVRKLNRTNRPLECSTTFGDESIFSNIPYLGMEYCAGGDLRHLLRMPENLSGLKEPEVLKFLGHICSAIQYLHQSYIYHRDIKPANILIQKTPRGSVYKLSDLGLAKAVSSPDSSCSSYVGTDRYLAPEIRFDVKYDRTADYFSLGMVVYEVCCGKLPVLDFFQKMFANPAAITDHKIDCEIPFKTHLSECLRTYLTEWLKRMLEIRPEKRGRMIVQTENTGHVTRCCIEIIQEYVSQLFLKIHTPGSSANFLLPIQMTTTMAYVHLCVASTESDKSGDLLPPYKHLLLTEDGQDVKIHDQPMSYALNKTEIYVVATQREDQVNPQASLPILVRDFLFSVNLPLDENSRELWTWLLFYVETEVERAEKLINTHKALKIRQTELGIPLSAVETEFHIMTMEKKLRRKRLSYDTFMFYFKDLKPCVANLSKYDLRYLRLALKLHAKLQRVYQKYADDQAVQEMRQLDSCLLQELKCNLFREYQHWESASVKANYISIYTVEDANRVRRCLEKFISTRNDLMKLYNNNIRFLLKNFVSLSAHEKRLKQGQLRTHLDSWITKTPYTSLLILLDMDNE